MKQVRWIVTVVAGLTLASGCQTVEEAPTSAYDGGALYVGYCASCHGPAGAGDGPVAASLASTLEDLRTIEQRRGVFARDWLREVIDGRTLRAAHGTRNMPVWGFEFGKVEESAAEVDARIDAVIDFLQAIQQTTPDAG